MCHCHYYDWYVYHCFTKPLIVHVKTRWDFIRILILIIVVVLWHLSSFLYHEGERRVMMQITIQIYSRLVSGCMGMCVRVNETADINWNKKVWAEKFSLLVQSYTFQVPHIPTTRRWDGNCNFPQFQCYICVPSQHYIRSFTNFCIHRENDIRAWKSSRECH